MGGCESCGGAAAVALGDGFEVLGIDGDVLLIVLVGFEDGDQRFEREAFVDGEDELFARCGEALHGLDALLDRWAVKPLGKRIEGGSEPPRDLGDGLVGVGEGDEDVGGGFFGGLEVEELSAGTVMILVRITVNEPTPIPSPPTLWEGGRNGERGVGFGLHVDPLCLAPVADGRWPLAAGGVPLWYW